MTTNTKFKLILIILLLIFVIFYSDIFSSYQVSNVGEYFVVNENNKISGITIDSFILYIDVNSKFQNNYFLEKIEVIYHNKILGNIPINKNLRDLNCSETNCSYDIPPDKLSSILNQNEIFKKIKTQNYEYNRNYFEYKIVIKNKKIANQKEEFLVDMIGIRYKKWYDFDFPFIYLLIW